MALVLHICLGMGRKDIKNFCFLILLLVAFQVRGVNSLDCSRSLRKLDGKASADRGYFI